jgi:hypothetical protein
MSRPRCPACGAEITVFRIDFEPIRSLENRRAACMKCNWSQGFPEPKKPVITQEISDRIWDQVCDAIGFEKEPRPRIEDMEE